ncbi:MAG: HAD-IA family hydrolase [Candidatus Saccharibacteria bacterium]|nr:HAD-IA family hydrolase [Moraxellaceae bacterium]
MNRVSHSPLSTLKLAIFDWDGTVMDSVSQIVTSLLAVGRHFDVELEAAAAQHIIGLALPVAMQQLFPNHTNHIDEMRRVYAEHYHAHPDAAPVFAGFPAMFDALRDQGVQLAVATGKNRNGLDRVLAQSGLGDYFTITRSADEANSKPDPLMLQQILEITGIDAADAVMIGDTTFDLQMAQAINMPRIGVLWGAHSEALLTECDPHALVSTVGELSHILGVKTR